MHTVKRISLIAATMGAAVLITVAGCGRKTASDQAISLDTDRAKGSYTVGVNIGRNFKDGYVDVDPMILERGMQDVLENRTLLMSDEQMTEAMNTLQTTIQDQYQKIVTDNQKAASDFLAGNAKKEGVVTLPDSLQYQIITAGTGPKPAISDTVEVQYHGTLLDGTVFDSSVQRNEPVQFGLDQVIPGWTEVLQLMPVGSKWRVFIPPQFAYGEEGRPGIPPNSLLTFEIELLQIL